MASKKKKPSLEAAYAAAVKPAPKTSSIDRDYPELVPFVEKWLEARKRGDDVITSAAEFHRKFMVPNGYKETTNAFLSQLRNRFADLWTS